MSPALDLWWFALLSLLSWCGGFLLDARLLLKVTMAIMTTTRSTDTPTPIPMPTFEPVLNPLELGFDDVGTFDSSGDEAPDVVEVVAPWDSGTDIEATVKDDVAAEDTEAVPEAVTLSPASIVERLAGGGALNVESVGLLQETAPSADRPQHAHSWLV